MADGVDTADLAHRDGIAAVAGLLDRLTAAQRALGRAGPAEVLTVACEQACRLLPADSVVVATRDGEEVLARASTGSGSTQRGDRLPVTGTLAGAALRTGEPQLCRDATSDPRTDPEQHRRRGVRSSIVAPLAASVTPADPAAAAVLAAYSSQPDAFDRSHLRLLELLAELTASRLASAVAVLDSDVAWQGLAERDRMLSASEQLAGAAWWEYDVRADRHRWSEQMYRIVGLEPDGPAPRLDEWLELVHPDDRARLRRVPWNRGRQSERFRVVRADGSVRVLRAWSEVEADESGEPVRLVGTTVDVTDRERAAARLSAVQLRLTDAHGRIGLAWWEYDARAGTVRWSYGMRHVVGSDELAVMSVTDWLRLLHPDDVAAAGELRDRALTEGVSVQHLFRILLPDGSLRFHEVWAEPVHDEQGLVVGLHGAALDVTAREEAARALAESEQHFRVAFDNAPTGMVLLSLAAGSERRVQRANAAFARMLGAEPADIVGTCIEDWSHPGDVPTVRQRLRRMLVGDVEAVAFEQRFLDRAGGIVHAMVTSTAVADGTGAPVYAISHCVDVTEQRRARAELERLALTDSLTGLANRALLEDRLGRALRRLDREHGCVGLLLLDVDRFKVVNDSLGHQQGDALLVEMGRRLQAVTRADTTVARLGGDEFVVLLEHAGSVAEVEHAARRILGALREPYELPGGYTLVSTASLGMATATSAGRSPGDLYREADLALYRAKDLGRDRHATFDAELRSRAVRRLDTEHRLRSALREDRVRAVFQPVVDLTTRTIVGAETLARLDDPDRGVLTPSDFVRVAEDTGLVVDLDTRMAERAVAWLAARPGTARPDRVAINISAPTLEQPEFGNRLAAALRHHRVSGDRLLVEITERLLVESGPAVSAALARLGDLGVRIGVDDFGTGYSALAYLQLFPLDFLKIDRSFVARLGRPKTDALVAAVVDLAHAHNLLVVAEGVETAEQAGALSAMGCEQAQGWLFGAPHAWP